MMFSVDRFLSSWPALGFLYQIYHLIPALNLWFSVIDSYHLLVGWRLLDHIIYVGFPSALIALVKCNW